MNQRVFIVDQSPFENKFAKFTQNIEEFPTSPGSNNYRNHEMDKTVDVRDLLRELTLTRVRPSQLSGQFLFSISPPPDNKYNLYWCSFGSLTAVLRLVGFFLQLTYYFVCNDQVTDRFGIEDGGNSTLGVTELILTLTIFTSDFIGSFLFYWKGTNSTLRFLNRLGDILVLFAEDVKGSVWIQEWFKQTTRKTRRLVRVVNLSILITTLIMAHKDIYKIILYLQGTPSLDVDFFTWTFPIFAFGWFFVLFHRLHFRLWLMSIIDTLQFGFQIVKGQIQLLRGSDFPGNIEYLKGSFEFDENGDKGISFREESDKTQADNLISEQLKEIKLTQILEKYRTMEHLLEDFNELFASHLLIGILSNVVVILMALFHFFVEVNYKLSGTSGIFAIEAVVYTLVLFSMGTAATDMANEADACISTLRDVPLGSISAGLKQKIMLHFQHAMALPLVVSPGYFFSLNRKMLTSVAGTLTTYLIVLIQFQTSEKPGSAEDRNSTRVS